MIKFKTQKRVINRFEWDYGFLSNFAYCPVRFGKIVYPTAEHAYQAQKTQSLWIQESIAALSTPGAAKRAGRKIALRDDWEQIKLEIMEQIVMAKFLQNGGLRLRLLETGNADLIEGNYWGDTFWGVCNGHGQNHLGKILMKVRAKLRGKQ